MGYLKHKTLQKHVILIILCGVCIKKIEDGIDPFDGYIGMF